MAANAKGPGGVFGQPASRKSNIGKITSNFGSGGPSVGKNATFGRTETQEYDAGENSFNTRSQS